MPPSQAAEVAGCSSGGWNLLTGQAAPALSPEQQRLITLKKQLVEKVKKTEPEATGKLIQAWLNEGAR